MIRCTAQESRPSTAMTGNILTCALLLITVLNLIPAAAFIATSHKPGFDETYNLPEAQRYASEGFSAKSIGRQTTAPGPVSFIWMAEAIRLFPGNPLRAARLSVLVSWLLLVAAVSALARLWCDPNPLLAGLFSLLAFPHTVLTFGLVLTEGPALLFALTGTGLWLGWVTRERDTPGHAIGCLSGAFLMGLAVASRQYFLALLPAMAVVLFVEWRNRGRTHSSATLVMGAASVMTAALPVLWMVSIWRGLASPGSAHAWQVAVGLNVMRIVPAIFYVAFYLFPFTFLWIGHLQARERLWAAVAGLVFAIALAPLRAEIVHLSPLLAIVDMLAQLCGLATLTFSLVSGLASASAFAVATYMWRQRFQLVWSAPLVFSVVFILLFVLEQISVAPGPGFYDRYMLQVIPFMGMMVLAVRPAVSFAPVPFLLAFWGLGEAMLWRYAFRG